MRRQNRNRILILAGVAAVVIGPGVCARLAVHLAARGRVFTDQHQVPDCRVALVLGAKVTPDGKPCQLLADRIDTAIDLYRSGKVSKLLMSGDNRFSHYSEPARMRDYAIRHGVPPDDIRMDFAGRRTYDSVYRAKHIFGLSECIVVSQGFHVDRAVFLGKHIGIRVYGVPADVRGHVNPRAIVREMPACIGALADVYLRHPKPVMGRRERI